MFRVLGIYREPEHSPDRVEVDKAIMDAVLARLSDHGCSTEVSTPDYLREVDSANFDLVLAMCKSAQSLELLRSFENAGVLVVNSADSIRRCYRDMLNHILKRAGVPTPPGELIAIPGRNAAIDLRGLVLERGVFVKPADPLGLSSGCVVEVRSLTELNDALTAFVAKGIRWAYLQQALSGTVVKFYGVSGEDFFVPCGLTSVFAGVNSKLAQIARMAAAALGLEVWGGDAVVNEQGVFLIDLNDWPSFAPIRELAAAAIAKRCLSLLSARKKK